VILPSEKNFVWFTGNQIELFLILRFMINFMCFFMVYDKIIVLILILSF
jgi:hypothetical protein